MKIWRAMTAMVAVAFLATGCAVNFYKQSPKSKQKIKELETKVDELERLRMEEQAKFEEVKKRLQKELAGEIAGDQVSVRAQGGGIAIILSDNILFDSGKAVIKDAAMPTLDKIAAVINSEVAEKNIGVEGHTDNVPIKYSKWESNWDLSTARARKVLYYLEKQGVSSARLSATGYGEHRPIASNDSPQGQAKNRRVEVVILPEYAEKKYETPGAGEEQPPVK